MVGGKGAVTGRYTTGTICRLQEGSHSYCIDEWRVGHPAALAD